MWPRPDPQPLMPSQRYPIHARPVWMCQFSGCTRPVMAQLMWRGVQYGLCELHLTNASMGLR